MTPKNPAKQAPANGRGKRGRPKSARNRNSFDLSMLVWGLFEAELAKGKSYQQASELVLRHADMREHMAKAKVQLSPASIEKRYQRFADEIRNRRHKSLLGELPDADLNWDPDVPSDSDP